MFDDLGRDIISSVLRVNDLRGFGVTIHLLVYPGIALVEILEFGKKRS